MKGRDSVMKKTELDYINENKKALFNQNTRLKGQDARPTGVGDTLKNSSINKQYQNSLNRMNSERTVVNQHHYVETSTHESTNHCSNNSDFSSDDCGSSD